MHFQKFESTHKTPLFNRIELFRTSSSLCISMWTKSTPNIVSGELSAFHGVLAHQNASLVTTFHVDIWKFLYIMSLPSQI